MCVHDAGWSGNLKGCMSSCRQTGFAPMLSRRFVVECTPFVSLVGELFVVMRVVGLFVVVRSQSRVVCRSQWLIIRSAVWSVKCRLSALYVSGVVGFSM